jgi:hypothetical protein
MSSLADLPEVVGFFSYSRDDDKDSFGALSALRGRIQGELRGQLGRTAKSFRLWQDREAIPFGTLWQTEIKNAAAQSVFFIPIITPTVVASPHCKFELDAFLAREAELGRSDLVFPILYIDLPALEDDARRQNDPVLSLIAERHYADWRKLRHRDIQTADVGEAVEQFCKHIRDALSRHRLTPEELDARERASALERADADRGREEAEAQRRAEAKARERTEDARRKAQHETETEPRTAPGKHQAEQARRIRSTDVSDPARSRRQDVIVGIIGAVIVGFLLPRIGFPAGEIEAAVYSFIGAVILLIIVRLIQRK